MIGDLILKRFRLPNTLRETFAEAMATEASAVVLGFHSTLGFGLGLPMEQVEGYEPFTSTLEEVVERFGKPVLAIHGEAHEFTVDQPPRAPQDQEAIPQLHSAGGAGLA